MRAVSLLPIPVALAGALKALKGDRVYSDSGSDSTLMHELIFTVEDCTASIVVSDNSTLNVLYTNITHQSLLCPDTDDERKFIPAIFVVRQTYPTTRCCEQF